MDEIEPVDIQQSSLDGLLSRHIKSLRNDIFKLNHKVKILTKHECDNQVLTQRFRLQLDKKDVELKMAKEKLLESDNTHETLRRERDSSVSMAKDSSIALVKMTSDFEYKHSMV
jgi:hypothetical protein